MRWLGGSKLCYICMCALSSLVIRCTSYYCYYYTYHYYYCYYYYYCTFLFAFFLLPSVLLHAHFAPTHTVSPRHMHR